MLRLIQFVLFVLVLGLIMIAPLGAQIGVKTGTQTAPLRLTLHFLATTTKHSAALSEFGKVTSTGNTLNILTAEHWHQFQQGIRRGQPGLYITSPHFAAWAIHEHGFQPVIRLASPLSYVIAVAQNDAEIFEMNDLAGHIVCSGKPLKLDYLLINRAFDNPVLSARIKVVESVPQEMRRANSACRGFSLTDQQFQALALEFPNRYIRVQQSVKYNNLVLIADPDSVTRYNKEIDELRYALQSESGRKALTPLVTQWSSSTSWVSARASEYPPAYAKDLAQFWR